MRWTRWLLLVLVLVSLAVLVLFYLQNSLRLTDLSLNLGFAAWRLANPVPVPALLLGALGTGVLLGAVLGLWMRRGGDKAPAPRAGEDLWT